jgi:hypothetical protein
MAKRVATQAETNNSVEGTTTAADVTLETFAEDLGRMIGSAQNKAANWLQQRDSLVKHLENVRDSASQLLTQLGHTASETLQTVRRGRRRKKYAAPKSNPAGGMKPLHRAQKVASAAAPKTPLAARQQGRFPQARRAPK